ncbi:hypothetical protein KC19_5G188500 [Ceratodon purpureus]|uniref:Uncharacterized protein n=1 Tax=Ceratodon purpureus TaxID=3225 RepID=A0A8T0I4P3_CERPU|nr:hypothetical protein KC19_5G188500 [Ceratodon purpureus]
MDFKFCCKVDEAPKHPYDLAAETITGRQGRGRPGVLREVMAEVQFWQVDVSPSGWTLERIRLFLMSKNFKIYLMLSYQGQLCSF